MTLEAILTFWALLIAVYAIPRPVHRKSIGLFAPTQWLVIATFIAWCFLIVRDLPLGINPWNLPITLVREVLTISSFSVLVLTSLLCWLRWDAAVLNQGNASKVKDLIQTAIREGHYDEIERIIHKNKDKISNLPDDTLGILFDPKVVAAFVSSRSMLHLELLTNPQFLDRLAKSGIIFVAVDATVRELLLSTTSPIRATVLKRFGGVESAYEDPKAIELFTRTFGNPKWYRTVAAHYPLLVTAIESLNGSPIAVLYNQPGDAYYTNQGYSTRAHCPVYLAAKTHVLALQAAIREEVPEDYYVTDLSDLFRVIVERSQFDASMWSRGYREYPTPNAYLLYEIVRDLEELSTDAVKRHLGAEATHGAGAPRILSDLAQTWALCTGCIANSQGKVSDIFRAALIDRHLRFILALGWMPNDSFPPQAKLRTSASQPLRDLFFEYLRRAIGTDRIQPVRDVAQRLDEGKIFIRDGIPWLRSKLVMSDRRET